jgi:2-hydroxychromene-2-carboxylate isomerase
VPAAQPVFYYDLGDPGCYLVAERVMTALPIVPEWEPVDGSRFEPADVNRSSIEQLAAGRDMQPLRWPKHWPPDTGTAMLAATYAKRVGRAVAFSLAAFRQAFAAGRDLGDTDTILIAAAACEMHPTALLKGITLRSVKTGLQQATDRALSTGVRSLPAIEVGGEVFEGDGGVERGAEALEVGA